MKRWKSLTAALCAAVLLCGFSAVPAFAYADGGEGENYGDPTMTEETTAPEPEPTIEPVEGFSEEGNLVTRDLLYDEHTNKQFITVETRNGHTLYIVIDYDKLLEDAKKRYKKVLKLNDEAKNLFIYDREAKKYWSVQNKYLAARDEYLDWEKKNVDKLGVRLITNFNNGTPIGITAVISGHDNFGRGTL